MSLKLVHTRKVLHYTCSILEQEFETHRGGRIIIRVENDSDSYPIPWKDMADEAQEIAWDTYYHILGHGGDLSKDYYIPC